jgi:nicotinate-nucleotide adenylyltransferase
LSQRIGILGGTFNPIHLGHLAAAEEVRDRLKLDSVLFIPAFLPPHKSESGMPSAAQRQEMVGMAIRGNPHFQVSDIEIRRGGRSYTIDTIEELRRSYPGAELVFITGLDTFLDIRTWKEWERLLTVCSFAVLSREGFRFRDLAGFGFLQVPLLDLERLDAGEVTGVAAGRGAVRIALERIPLYDVSSTDIRSRVHGGRSVKYRLPEAVEGYIIENKLYV